MLLIFYIDTHIIIIDRKTIFWRVPAIPVEDFKLGRAPAI